MISIFRNFKYNKSEEASMRYSKTYYIILSRVSKRHPDWSNKRKHIVVNKILKGEDIYGERKTDSKNLQKKSFKKQKEEIKMKMNLQYFGGRGSAAGKRTGKRTGESGSGSSSTSDVITAVSNKAQKDWGNNYVPLTEKETSNLTKKLEKFDSSDFKNAGFGDDKKRKIEGLPGQFRFIDHKSDGLLGRYEVNYITGGVTHAAVGKTPKQAISEASKQFKEVTVRETLFKKRKK